MIYYLQINDDIYAILEDYNLTKKRKLLIVLEDMIADMEFNEKLLSIVTELFLKRRKLNFSLIFTPQFYFKVLTINCVKF